MNRAYKELFLNTVYFSLGISAVFAGIVSTVNDESPLGFSWGFNFLGIFLFIYFYNLIVSVINFALSLFCKSLVMRLVLFNIVGLLLTALPAYHFHEWFLLSLYASFIVLSAHSIWSQRTADRP
ncbi:MULTISPECIES: hypothetical protein [Paenibacillus]|uniref:Transporter n=1 Tax=Paenibacillus borealis TaxID=160799 RepID=A0ABX3H7Q0_PAEBO|nr:hypothetical protein [Paenibacillus borealis]OMD46383.1 hypothetical protein BSK56_16215 [Paenibacillus borealis]